MGTTSQTLLINNHSKSTTMHNLTHISAVALLASATALAHALPETTPAPTLMVRQDRDEIESSLSDAVASATSALADHPDDTSSILSDLREQYTSIEGDATGCGSDWARITNAIDEFDDGFLDGIFNVADEIFGDGDDECEIEARAQDGNEENGAASSRAMALWGAAGAVFLAVAVVL